MYQALIDSHLAPAYAPGSGFDSSCADATFGIGVEGIAESDIGGVAEAIQTCLGTTAALGFEFVE
jgi:hypothetical protein